MLAFDDEFRLSSDRNHCTLWADESRFKRVRFSIDTHLLPDVPQGGNTVHDFADLALCESERSRIEAACRRAFAKRASTDIELEPTDFEQR
jgi:hypothetical protein